MDSHKAPPTVGITLCVKPIDVVQLVSYICVMADNQKKKRTK